MLHTATLSHKQALTKLIGHFWFMQQSRSVRHPQLCDNNNNNNPICKAPECQKTSVALQLCHAIKLRDKIAQ